MVYIKTVTTKDISALIHQVFYDMGITSSSQYEITQNSSINVTIIIYDYNGMNAEKLVQKFNETVEFYISSTDKVEMKHRNMRFIVTTNYNIIDNE